MIWHNFTIVYDRKMAVLLQGLWDNVITTCLYVGFLKGTEVLSLKVTVYNLDYIGHEGID